MTDNPRSVILGDEGLLSLAELCRLCRVNADQIQLLVEEGVLEPSGAGPGQWRFESLCILRVRRVVRLERDLGVNLAGAALAAELLDEIDRLRARLRRLGEF
ncbi:MAG: chaperone modulator CbpM [Porticoccaceae bacterium]